MLRVEHKKILGKGGYGTVFEGIFNEEIRVAVKRILITDIASSAQEEVILQELNHPNVITFFHAESDANFRLVFRR